MFETLAPYIIAGLLIVTGYTFSRWLACVEVAKHWRASAEISFRHNDELSEQIAGMQEEGCAAVGLVQNIFNGLTSPSALRFGASVDVQGSMADACAKLLVEATRCDHKAGYEDMFDTAERLGGELTAARLNAENWQNLAVESEGRMEEAERLLGLANDRLLVAKSYDAQADEKLQ